MRFLFSLITFLGLMGTVNAQSNFTIHIRSDAHQPNAKITLIKDWPVRQVADSAILKDGVANLLVTCDKPTIFTIQMRHPHATVTFVGGEGDVDIQIGENGECTVAGGELQSRLQKLEQELKPLEEQWRKAGEKFSSAVDMEEKIEFEKETGVIFEKVLEKKIGFIRENSENVAGAWIADENMYLWPPSVIAELANVLSSNKEAGIVLEKLNEKKKELELASLVGSKAADFTLKSIAGDQMSLKDLLAKNEFVLVDFWASWCAPCRLANRNIAPMYSRLKEKGIEIVSISVDENEADWKKAVQADGIPWPQVLYPNALTGNLIEEYRVQSLPSTFLVNKNGVIVKQKIDIEDLNKLIQ